MKKFFAITLLCVMIAGLCVFTGCKGSEGATADEIAISTTVADTTEEITTQTESETTAAEKATTEAKENTPIPQKTKPVQNEQQIRPDDGGNSVSGKPADREESDKTATITVGGKAYTVNVGDRVVYTCYLKTPKAIENIQASLSYDDSVLWLRQGKSKEMFPNLSGTIYNANMTGTVLFNASEPMEGYDFTGKGVLVTLNFDVAKEGNTEIATAIEFMDEIGGNSYVDNFSIVGNITITETLS